MLMVGHGGSCLLLFALLLVDPLLINVGSFPGCSFAVAGCSKVARCFPTPKNNNKEDQLYGMDGWIYGSFTLPETNIKSP